MSAPGMQRTGYVVIGSVLSEEPTINAVDVARKGILNVYLQTAIYVYMKIRMRV